MSQEPDERLGLPSASALEIAVLCPGQPNLKSSLLAAGEKLDESENDAYAIRGTRIHGAFETGNDKELNEEEYDTYHAGLKFEEELVQQWMADNDIGEAVEGPRELRVFLHDPATLQPIASAKLDRHYVWPPHALIIDLKSGWNRELPPSVHSWQLRLQALVLWAEEYEGLTRVRVAHCKPKFKAGAEDWCDYTETDLKASEQSVQFHLWETRQPNAQRRAGMHCGYCPCKTRCPEAGAFSLLPSVMAIRAMPDRAEVFDAALAVSRLTLPDLARIWEQHTVIEKILKAVTARLKTLTDEEREQLGLTLGKGNATNQITAVKDCFYYLRDSDGWPESKIFECMEFVNGRLAEIARVAGKMTKKDAETWVKTALSKFITPGETEKILRKSK